MLRDVYIVLLLRREVPLLKAELVELHAGIETEDDEYICNRVTGLQLLTTVGIFARKVDK